MAVGQRQRLYSGVRMFTGNYLSLSSTPRELRTGGVELECKSLIYAIVRAPTILHSNFLRATAQPLPLLHTSTTILQEIKPNTNTRTPLAHMAGLGLSAATTPCGSFPEEAPSLVRPLRERAYSEDS
jgi:hypothetical protein